MDNCQCLYLPSNVIIFIGSKPSNTEILISRKPGFFDAVKLSKQQPPSTENSPYQCVPLENSIKEMYRFYDLQLSKEITFTLQDQSLFIEGDQPLSIEMVYSILKYFLIKKGERVFFLTKPPIDHIRLDKNHPLKTRVREQTHKE